MSTDGAIAPPKKYLSKRNTSLDLIRGLAALAVCFDHVSHFTIDTTNSLLPSGITNLIRTLSNCGSIAVMIFFALSGYLVGGSVINKANQNRLEFLTYLNDRLTRLLTVLIPALILTTLWDHLGLSLGGQTGYSGGFREIYGTGPTPATPATHDYITFLKNLGFLQGITSPVYGSNGPLWSLSYEWWYYIIFPLIYVGIKNISTSKKQLLKGTVHIALSILIFLFIAKFMKAFFIPWCTGAIAHQFVVLSKNNITIRKLTIITSVGATTGILIFLSKLGLPSNNWEKLAFGILAAAALPVFATIRGENIKGKWIITWLSEISYTLYLFHYPVIAFLAFTYGKGQRYPLNWTSLCIAIVICIILLAYSTIGWWLFEKRTTVIRQHLKAIYSRYSPSNTKFLA